MKDIPHTIDLDNEEFQQMYKLLTTTNANVFLTGKAGSGKSTFLRYICNNIKKKYVVLAPTGVAAVNVGGVTIHSFFQMPLRPVPPDDDDYSIMALKKSRRYSKNKIKLIKELELIIIDEVSMVRPDMIDFIDRVLRAITGRRGKPFGGIQLLLVGDIFQLEPVVTNESRQILSKYYQDYFFFNARAYDSANLVSVELKKIYRQTDRKFISMLDRRRLSQTTTEDLAILNSRIMSTASDDGGDFGITLTTRRDVASSINYDKMAALSGEEYIFKGEIKDEFPEKILPTDLELVLKKGAQVMLIRNDRDHRWVNGTIAMVKDISEDKIQVELENHRVETVEKEEWQNINYIYDEKERKVKEEVIGTFSQYPLRAAWALTIHKSQGLTFGNVTIDMTGGAFTAGQTYVALSRCRSLEGVRFINPLQRSDIIVSRGASEFSYNYNDHRVIERVLREAESARLSKSAADAFSRGDFYDVVEMLWEADTLTHIFEKRSVRRMIAGFLSVITKLRKELQSKNRLLKEISKEFTELGEECMREKNDYEMALQHFSKAYKLDNDNRQSHFGMALCMLKIGKRKNGLKILEEFIKTPCKYTYNVRILRGDMCVEEEDYANAVIHYNAAMKLNKNSDEPIFKLIDVYEKCGMDDMAENYRKCIEN